MKSGLNTINTYILNANFGETIYVTASAISANATFVTLPALNNVDVVVSNAGTNIAFINFGTSSSTTASLPGTGAPTTAATTTSYPVLAGSIQTLQKNTDAQKNNVCAAISPAGTIIYFTSIQGS